MAGERRRRLVAILAADVVGYSRLVGADEEGTLARLRALFREVVQPTVAAYHGRVFKLMGDAVLAEFPSAVEAPCCAPVVQGAPWAGDGGPPPRIAVHAGDLVVAGDGSGLPGDGVNAAARFAAQGGAAGTSAPGPRRLAPPSASPRRGPAWT